MQIGLRGLIKRLVPRVDWRKTMNEVSRKVHLEICENSMSFDMRNLWTTGNLKLPVQNLHSNNFKNKFLILNKIKV